MKRLFIAARHSADAYARRFREELPQHEVLTRLPDDGAPVHYAVVGRPEPGLLARIPGLELILSLNAGVEHLLASGEVPPHVPVVRMVDAGLVEGMVEWVAAQVLVWHRNLPLYQQAQDQRRWAPLPEKLARDRMVTVLGAGALGGPVAATLAMLGFRVRVWSRTPRNSVGVQSFSGADQLADAAAGADVLVNLLPYTPATANVVDARLLARLAPGALLVNGGRGGTMADADVLAALDAGTLSRAALDVFSIEPLPVDDPYWGRRDVAVSPHVAAPTHVATSVEVMVESVRAWERGEAPAHLVDLQRGY